MLQRPQAVKQAEQKRADRRAVASFVPSKASHDAIAVALVLDLPVSPSVLEHVFTQLSGGG
jgi:hypothetical protein